MHSGGKITSLILPQSYALTASAMEQFGQISPKITMV
jgi:hypothetical protein